MRKEEGGRRKKRGSNSIKHKPKPEKAKNKSGKDD